MSQSDAILVGRAIAVRQHSYAPYSKFAVGAALRLSGGAIHVGANVENCSFGLTVCAERAAVLAACAAGDLPEQRIDVIVVVTDAPSLSAPCGACRQVLAEFAAPDARVILHNVRDDTQRLLQLADLLPHAFLPDSM